MNIKIYWKKGFEKFNRKNKEGQKVTKEPVANKEEKNTKQPDDQIKQGDLSFDFEFSFLVVYLY